MKDIKGKIKVGMWTKLPEGKVQEDTKDIAGSLVRLVGLHLNGTYLTIGQVRNGKS